MQRTNGATCGTPDSYPRNVDVEAPIRVQLYHGASMHICIAHRRADGDHFAHLNTDARRGGEKPGHQELVDALLEPPMSVAHSLLRAELSSERLFDALDGDRLEVGGGLEVHSQEVHDQLERRLHRRLRRGCWWGGSNLGQGLFDRMVLEESDDFVKTLKRWGLLCFLVWRLLEMR